MTHVGIVHRHCLWLAAASPPPWALGLGPRNHQGNGISTPVLGAQMWVMDQCHTGQAACHDGWATDWCRAGQAACHDGWALPLCWDASGFSSL